MTTLLKVLLLALASTPGWAVKMSAPDVSNNKILLGTMVFPDDTVPVDITLVHQSKMISTRPQKVQMVIVDNRPPWISNHSAQEEVISMMQEKTYPVEVLKVEWHSYKRAYKDPLYLQKFFQTGDPADTIETIEQAQAKSGQQMLGVLAFLEHCVKADDLVDLCIFLDPKIVVYREGGAGKGIADLAREAFDQNKNLTVINPPTMCDWEKSASDDQPIGLREVGIVSQRYFIVHRARLAKALPLAVPHNEFNVNFEHLFHIGLRSHSPYAARRMTSGKAFAISPNSEWAHCRHEQQLHIEKHSLLMGGSNHAAARTTGYYGLDQNVAEGLTELLKRVEEGKLPKPEDPWSITNSCQDMCPSPTRVQDGLAW